MSAAPDLRKISTPPPSADLRRRRRRARAMPFPSLRSVRGAGAGALGWVGGRGGERLDDLGLALISRLD